MTPASLNSIPLADPTVWCGIPVYNNAATIVDVVRRCRAQIANIVVIDDGSTDADLTELLKPFDVVVIRHPTNLGKGAALLTAFRYAAERGGRYLITLDGDGQHFPEDIPRFFPHLTPGTILIGYRDEVTGTMPRSSQFGREFSDFWIYLETGTHVRDTQSGFRVYPLVAICRLALESRHYNLEMEVITKALWAGMRAQTVMIRVWYPTAEERVSSFRPVRDNFRISLLHARLVARQLIPIARRKNLGAGSEIVRSAGPTKSASTDSKRLVGSALGTITVTRGANSECSPSPSYSGERAGVRGETSIGTERDLISETICPSPYPSPPGTRERGPHIPQASVFTMNAALTAGLSTFLGIVLWPYGALIVVYLVLRLHLNKIVAIVCIGLTLLPLHASLSSRIGHAVLNARSHSELERFVGSHVLAFPAAIAAAWLSYKIAGRIQTRR